MEETNSLRIALTCVDNGFSHQTTLPRLVELITGKIKTFGLEPVEVN